MKKLACISGVIFSYFSIFFSGQITFNPDSGKIPDSLQILIAGRSTFTRTAMCMKYKSVDDIKLNYFTSLPNTENPPIEVEIKSGKSSIERWHMPKK